MSHITDALKRFKSGRMSFPELKDYLVNREYPKSTRVDPSDPNWYHQVGDNCDNPPGSWNEVAAAAVTGTLTEEQYEEILDARRERAGVTGAS